MKNFTHKIVLLSVFLLTVTSVNAQWINLSSGTNRNLYEIQFINNTTGFVVGEKATVLKTNDAGSNWLTRNPPIYSDLHELFFLNENLGWVVGDSGKICKTIDGGNTWQIVSLPNGNDLHLHSIYALNQNIVFVGGSNASQNAYLFKSLDGGITWQASNVETYIWNIDILKIGMINSSTGYALTRGNVLKTTDEGLNWFITDTNSVKAGQMFSILEDLAVFPNNDTAYICGWYPAYFGSTINESDSWTHQANYDYYNLDFVNPTIGYVGGWGYMHKTSDGGNTFTDVSGGNTAMFSGIYSIDFIDENNGFACGEKGKIIKTISGGSTGLEEETNYKKFIYPNPASTMLYFDKRYDVKIYDLLGNLLVETKDVYSIDISSVKPGIVSIQLLDLTDGIISYQKVNIYR